MNNRQAPARQLIATALGLVDEREGADDVATMVLMNIRAGRRERLARGGGKVA